ncbi:unnamed protein product, partial [Ceratitis capitata]
MGCFELKTHEENSSLHSLNIKETLNEGHLVLWKISVERKANTHTKMLRMHTNA